MYQQLNGKTEGAARTNTICPTPEEILLKSVVKNDEENIKRIVKGNNGLLSHIYSEYNRPILLIACSKGVQAKTIKILIDLGADLYYSSDTDEEWQALHFAARSTKSDNLEMIVKNFNNRRDINSLARGSNALHILIRHGKNDSPEFAECAKILVQEGIDINQGDGDDISPILWAAKKGFKDIIKVILEYSKIPVDVDSHKFKKDTARDIIERKNLYDDVLPEKTDNQNGTDSSILFKYLLSKNENAFLNFKSDSVNADNTSSTLLQISCEKRLKRAAEHLINKGADPNLTTSKNRKTPIEITIDTGSYEIFEILLNHPKILVPKTVLVTLIKNFDNQEFPGISHRKCYNVLFTKLHSQRGFIDVNETDEPQNSPLHYAVRYSDPEKVENLLELGASLGSKNKNKVMPIHDMEPELLEKHLDSCIQFDFNGKKFKTQNSTITFNYHTLIPPCAKKESNVTDEINDIETNLMHNGKSELVAETEVISYMCQAPEFRHLLKHPVIVSFLFMKWHRIRWLFYTNLAFYIAFFLSLVVYIFVCYANFSDDSKSSIENFISNLSFGVFLLTFIILIFRELFQITVSLNYFKNFENYVEIVLIFFTGSILFISNPEDDTRKILSSVSILLAAFELVLIIGQHPKLSTNVVMLKTVSLNFFKFLMWYSLLIIAFALSFYILFSKTNVDAKSGSKTDEKKEDFFTNPGTSVFKTIIMLTGEFDAGSLNESFRRFPITSQIMFALFVFMIAIILFNLLNGLAVSDTQQIQNNAELVGHIATAQHIQYVESMLVGNISPRRNILKKINDFCCCFPEASNCTFTIPKPLAKTVCLFPHYRLDYKLKDGQIYFEKKKTSSGRNCISSYGYIYLDKETTKRTYKIIEERRETLKVNNEDNELRKEISELHKKLDHIIKNINSEN